jgi:hypothetical protein
MSRSLRPNGVQLAPQAFYKKPQDLGRSTNLGVLAQHQEHNVSR